MRRNACKLGGVVLPGQGQGGGSGHAAKSRATPAHAGPAGLGLAPLSYTATEVQGGSELRNAALRLNHADSDLRRASRATLLRKPLPCRLWHSPGGSSW